MSKTLEQRLLDVQAALDQVYAALARHPGKLSVYLEESFRTTIDYRTDIKYWLTTLEARYAAFEFLDRLETRVDSDDRVPLGSVPIKFQHARLIGVEAYITMTWALADQILRFVGRVLCTPDMGFDESHPPQIVSHFINRNSAKKSAAGLVFYSLREAFGWPVCLSYAIRNHFVHDGAYLNGEDFFEGPTPASAFRISTNGWDRVVNRAESYGVDGSWHRHGAGWLPSPRDDLRTVLRNCEQEMDDALGTLIGSASHSLKSHIGFLLGED